MNFFRGLTKDNDLAKMAGDTVGNFVEAGLNSFLGGEGQQDGDDGKKDVNEEPPSGGQTDEDNSGFGLTNALVSSDDGQKDPDNGGFGSGDAKGGGQKNDDNMGAGEPGLDAAAAGLGELLDQKS